VALFLQRAVAMRHPTPPWLALLGGTLLAACTGTPGPDPDCAEGKCDLPDDPAEVSCTKRRADAFNDNRFAFTETHLRWSCADVQGVTDDDRGQEYCEYFAIAELPGGGAATILGRNLGEDSSYGTTPAAVDLDPAQIAALEADEARVVGQCVFTSWNSDIPGPTPRQAYVHGVPVDEASFRMMFSVNSADAAQILVEDCFTIPEAGGKDPRDPRHDDFMRGCLWNADINGTEFRKSDSFVCASMVRLAECGCSVTGPTPLAELVSAFDVRGFRLGGWSGFVPGDEGRSRLPPSCRYVDLGDASQTLVTCDLTAGDLLYGAADLKAHCADKYADNIVVHVPIEASMVRCDPSSSSSSYAEHCTATPWILSPY
jgi:hypothetical protein